MAIAAGSLLWPFSTKEVNWRLAKRPLKTNGCLANRQLTSIVKEAIVIWHPFRNLLSFINEFSLIQILMEYFLHFFTHDMTAQLSCRVQNL